MLQGASELRKFVSLLFSACNEASAIRLLVLNSESPDPL